jgi:type II secretory ATPase GspE/PulE/Tfp pilus assembly ATPase PilB-like protein
MKAAYNGKKKELAINTAGSTAGESARIEVDPKSRYELKLEELGFSDEQLELMTNRILDSEGGIVILSAPRGQGLTSLVYGVLRRHDAFLTHILTVEKDPPTELEGITQNKFGGKEGPDEAKQTEWVVSQEPDVLALPLISDHKAAAAVVRYVENGKEVGKRAYVGLRATSTFDALRQWRKLVGDDKAALRNLRLVVNGRLVRKLCMACKVGYTPEPDVLRRLNMSPEKVGKLFQARTEPLRDPRGNPIPCEFCNDLRFIGRTGVFEVFAVDDDVRASILSGGSDNQLKQLFRKQRRRYLQEEALLKVQAGDTSVQEVLRALKTDSSSHGGGDAGPRPASSGPKRPAPAPA